MLVSLLKSLAFLRWVNVMGPQCANVTLGPTLWPTDLCPQPAWIVTMQDEVGLAACDDTDIFISAHDTVVHVDSVAEMQGMLRA